MILEFHPDIPGKQYDRPYKFIGYWHSVGTDFTTGLDFERYEEKFGSDALPLAMDYVDATWSEVEREKVALYLKTGKEFGSWRGNSWCRFRCGERLHGFRDLTDGTYIWPESFAHYIENHNVKPVQEFIDHVLKASRT